MPVNQERNRKVVLLAGDVALIIASSWFSFLILLGRSVNVVSLFTGATGFSLVTFLFSFYAFDLYNLNFRFQSTQFLSRYFFAILSSAILLSFAFYLFPQWQLQRSSYAFNLLMVGGLTSLWRILFQYLSPKALRPKRVALVGAGSAGSIIHELIEKKKDYTVAQVFDDDPSKTGTLLGRSIIAGDSGRLCQVCTSGEVDIVVVSVTHEKRQDLINNLMECKLLGVEIVDMPYFYEVLSGKIPVMHVRDSWIVYTPFQGMRRTIYTAKFKRLLDIGVSLAGLALSLPVMVLAALAIKLESKGPIFFTQNRVGLDGRVFRIIKFRSMGVDAESKGAVWAKVNDPRVTRVGAFLRKTRIDELPQMFNVLLGEMSFVGPRPERPEFVGMLKEEIPFYSLRHAVKAGITGWAQVNYPYGASREDALEKLQYDLFYIKNLSPTLDLQIMLRTIRVVLFGDGAR